MSMPGQEDSAWTTNEMGVLNLGDKRLDKRMVRVLKQLSEKPGPGIPTACKGWAETLAAYRLFDNDKVTMEKVLAAHEKATAGRISQHPVVLCIEDTTELDYTDKKETVGLGQLSFKARQGLLLHPMLAVTPERIPLGCLRSFLWARDPEIHEKKKDRKRQAIEKKESVRWIEGYRFITELAPQLPETRLVYVADRESDVYELFVAAGQAADLLVRAAQNRRLADGGNLWEQMERSSALGTVSFDLPRRGKRPGRLVVQTLRDYKVDFDNVMISSNHPKEIQTVEQLEPKIITALLFRATNAFNIWFVLDFLAILLLPLTKYYISWLVRRAHADYLNINHHFLDEKKVALFKKNGIKICVWTVNSRRKIEYFKSLGVDGIITNYPDRL